MPDNGAADLPSEPGAAPGAGDVGDGGTLLAEALRWADELHRGQVRKGGGAPVLSHLLGVAALVLEHGGDERLAAAALLHDALEDADGADRAAFEQRFGPEGTLLWFTVLALSDGVDEDGRRLTRDASTWRERKQAYLAHLAATDDPRELIVAAADKLHNARSLATELRAGGTRAWKVFNAPAADVLWFLRSCATVTARRLPGPLADELAAAVAEVATLSSQAGGDPGPRPAVLECSVGGFLGVSYSVRLDGDEVAHDTIEHMQGARTIRRRPRTDEWLEFWDALDSVGAWRWSGTYEPPGGRAGLDARPWAVTILHGTHLLAADGAGAYPPVGDAAEGPFARFRQAVAALAGGPFR